MKPKSPRRSRRTPPVATIPAATLPLPTTTVAKNAAPAQAVGTNDVPASTATTAIAAIATEPAALDAKLPLPEAPLPPIPVPLAAWRIGGDAVMGLAHRRKGIPCQDAVAWRNAPRPILALSDGAGSAVVSEKGAKALVSGVSRFLMSCEDLLAPWLDQPCPTAAEEAVRCSHRVLAQARGLLDDLAHAERRSVRDLRATLLLAVVGQCHTFWWQVGDGAIVYRDAHGLRMLGNPATTKGEFANQTCFVDAASAADVQFGLLATPDVSGLALMSDGGAEKLVAHDGSRVAARISEWLGAVAEERFTAADIAVAFHEPALWQRTTLDDRSIVLAARAGG